MLADARLVAMARRGDEQAMEKLVIRYYERILENADRRLNNRADAEDAAQETFLKVFLKLHSYNPEFTFRTWLYRVSNNLCIDLLRRRRCQPVPVPSEWLEPRLIHTENVEEPRAKVQAAMAALTRNYRQVLLLKYRDGLSYAQISRHLGISSIAVETRLHRARKQLAHKIRAVT